MPEIKLKKLTFLPDNYGNTFNRIPKAPQFKGKDQNGNTVNLSDYKNKKLALFFYPEDDTPTCTIEACNLRDNYHLLKKTALK